MPNDGNRTDAALEDLISAARETIAVLEHFVRLVEPAAGGQERKREQ